MQTKSDIHPKQDEETRSVEVIHIDPSDSGCEPDNNPAKPERKGGRVKFANRTKATITVTLEKEIFTEKGNPYEIAKGGENIYHVDESAVDEGEEVTYEIAGDKCTSSTTGLARARAALNTPKMIID